MNKEKPTLYHFLGLPGSGKTHFAKHLSERLGIVRLNSDSMRIAIFGSRDKTRELYESGNREVLNSYVFNAMDYATRELLAKGQSVIQDANHNRLSDRKNLIKLAAQHGGRAVLIHIDTPKDVATTRAQSRVETTDQRKLSAEEVADVHERHALNTDSPIDSETVIKIDGTVDFEDQFSSFILQLEQLSE